MTVPGMSEVTGRAARCYRSRYLSIRRLNYLGMIRHGSARIAACLITWRDCRLWRMALAYPPNLYPGRFDSDHDGRHADLAILRATCPRSGAPPHRGLGPAKSASPVDRGTRPGSTGRYRSSSRYGTPRRCPGTSASGSSPVLPAGVGGCSRYSASWSACSSPRIRPRGYCRRWGVMAAGLAGRCPGRKQAACAGAGQAGGRRQARLLRKLSLRDMAQRVAFTDESGLTSITSSPLAAQP